MFVIPYQMDQHTYNVFVALQDDNLERIKAYDPAQFEPAKMGAQWSAMHLGVVLIGYATEADVDAARQLQAEGRGAEIPHMLSRGFKFSPASGDYDGPYRETSAQPQG